MTKKLVVAAISVMVSACYAQDICRSLLSNNIFDTRDATNATANQDRLRSIYCSQQSSTKEGAKKVEAAAGYDGYSLGYGQSESEYEQWRSSLCTDVDSQSSSTSFSSESVRKASQSILDTFNKCVNRAGLTQYLERQEDDSYNFVWNLRFTPLGKGRQSIPVHPSATARVSCLLNGAKLPASIDVGIAGVNLLCTHDPCKPVTLTANSAYAAVFPSTIHISQDIGFTPTRPYKVVASETFDLAVNKGPYSIKVPRDMECKESHTGFWHPHCPNKAMSNACPALSITDGTAYSGDYDRNAYEDNCGVCMYTVECRPPLSTRSLSCQNRSAPKHIAAGKHSVK